MRLGIVTWTKTYPFDGISYKRLRGNNPFKLIVVMLHDTKDGFCDPSFYFQLSF